MTTEERRRQARARETQPPPGSRIVQRLPGAHFHDAWCIESDAVDRCALGHFLHASRHTPRWVDACMVLRNRAVALVGLKHLGELSAVPSVEPARELRPGDRVGVFTLFERSFDEVVLGDEDRHLDVHLSVHRRRSDDASCAVLTVSTVVHVKNALGHLYMLPVRPMHRLITRAMLEAAVASGD